MIEQQIYEIINQFRKNPENLEFDGSEITKKIKFFTNLQTQIICIFPACHGKVNHSDLVFDHRCDLSEYLCIQNLAKMNDQIKAIYPPGLKVYMVHEGHFYVDTGLIESDESMDEYMADVNILIQNHPFITSLSLKDFYKDISNNSLMRQLFLNQYCFTVDQMKIEINKNELYKKMFDYYSNRLRNLYGNADLNTEIKSNHGQNEKNKSDPNFEEDVTAKSLDQLRIWIGFRNLLDNYFKDTQYIRFSSVYKDPSVLNQVALNYAPVHHYEMPSFYCVCRDNNNIYYYSTKKMALKNGLKISSINGYKYFTENQ